MVRVDTAKPVGNGDTRATGAPAHSFELGHRGPNEPVAYVQLHDDYPAGSLLPKAIQAVSSATCLRATAVTFRKKVG